MEPFLRLIRGKHLESASMDERGAEDSNSDPQRRIKNDGTGGRSGAGRNLFLTFCVSEASVVVEGRRS